MIPCEVKILGCGGSGGVPLATGHWGKCNPNNPKNRRTRSSIAMRTERTSIIIDSGPDFHAQTLNHNINKIDAVIYTHEHADHINGIDDVRYAAIHRRIQGEKDFLMPVYGFQSTIDSLKARFDYIFYDDSAGLYIPLLESTAIQYYETRMIGDIPLKFFPQIHGSGLSAGIIVGDIAYSTDVSDLDEKALECLNGVKTWIVDCGQFDSPTTTVHANLEKVLLWNESIKASQLILTHLKSSEDYDDVNQATADYVEAAYDGLTLKTTI